MLAQNGFNSRTWHSISGDFSLADHTLLTRLEPAWPKMAQSLLNDTIQGQSPTMIEIKKVYWLSDNSDEIFTWQINVPA